MWLSYLFKVFFVIVILYYIFFLSTGNYIVLWGPLAQLVASFVCIYAYCKMSVCTAPPIYVGGEWINVSLLSALALHWYLVHLLLQWWPSNMYQARATCQVPRLNLTSNVISIDFSFFQYHWGVSRLHVPLPCFVRFIYVYMPLLMTAISVIYIILCILCIFPCHSRETVNRLVTFFIKFFVFSPAIPGKRWTGC